MNESAKRPGCHMIRPNHGCSVPQQCVLVHTLPVERPADGKDKLFYQKLGIGCAAFWRWEKGRPTHWEWVEFDTPTAFWSWLVGKHHARRSVWLFGHRIGAQLTMLEFFHLLDTGFYKLNDRPKRGRAMMEEEAAMVQSPNFLWCTRDPPTILQARHERHFLHAVDVRNYFNESLDTISGWVGLDRLPRPRGLMAGQAWRDHVRRDAEILKSSLVKLMSWWETNDMGVFRYTSSSLAFAHFRHKHLTTPIMIDDCEPARLISREALAAGECRLWYCGRVVDELTFESRRRSAPKGAPLRLRPGPIYVADVNSLYPSVMLGNEYPRKLVAYKERGDLADLLDWRKQLCLIARVQLDTAEHAFPAWANSERWWAIGQYWTTLAGPELNLALDLGIVRAVGAVAAYLPGRPFDSFVQALYPQKAAAKKAGDRQTERLCKLLLNSLAGKFGQQIAGWEWFDDPGSGQKWGSFPILDAETGEITLCRAIAGYVQHQQDKLDAPDSLPAVEAYVNSYGRVYMSSVRRRLPPGSWYYQDTDSLHLNDDGWNALQLLGLTDEFELGKFSLRGTYVTAHYRGPKDYTIDGEHYVAGRKADPVDSGADFYVQDETMQLDSILSRQPDGILVVERKRKKLGAYHPRGVLWSSGKVTPAKIVNQEVLLDPLGQPVSPKRGRSKCKEENLPF